MLTQLQPLRRDLRSRQPRALVFVPTTVPPATTVVTWKELHHDLTMGRGTPNTAVRANDYASAVLTCKRIITPREVRVVQERDTALQRWYLGRDQRHVYSSSNVFATCCVRRPLRLGTPRVKSRFTTRQAFLLVARNG